MKRVAMDPKEVFANRNSAGLDDIEGILLDLHSELRLIDQAILTLERLDPAARRFGFTGVEAALNLPHDHRTHYCSVRHR